jgi:hypothetical protein
VAAATAKYHNIANAIRDGYVPTNTCAELPGTGGMGYHYANPRLSSDNRLDPLHPEVLVYAPRPHGSRQLAALEYFKADDDQKLSTDKDRPSLFGVKFDGPMLGHEAGMPIHYDLHLWLWKHNPSGLFAMWNPRVHCPK